MFTASENRYKIFKNPTDNYITFACTETQEPEYGALVHTAKTT